MKLKLKNVLALCCASAPLILSHESMGFTILYHKLVNWPALEVLAPFICLGVSQIDKMQAFAKTFKP